MSPLYESSESATKISYTVNTDSFRQLTMSETFIHTVKESKKSQATLQSFSYRPLSLMTAQSYSIKRK